MPSKKKHLSHDDDDYEKPAIVMDNGTGMMKCGFCGDSSPRACFAACVG